MGSRRCWTICVVVLGLAADIPRAVRAEAAPAPSSGIAANAVRRVKQATVLLRVTDEHNQRLEGSGFFAIGRGVVVTNAHVLGMLRANSKPPAKIEVIVNSGAANETQLPGTLLGIDRSNDVAVLMAEGDQAPPASLLFGRSEDLIETQKVYIFGFPFGTELGKNITVSESSVSSLRTDAHGELRQIQVNGGMHPGNSGGPVVDAEGHVIGVSVAILRNTQINFAIPGHIVRALLAGNILEARSDQPFRDKGGVRVPLEYKCLDPFQRIHDMRVEVWAGKPEEHRAFSSKEAKPLPDDGPRASVSLDYAKNIAHGDVPLPKLKSGQVAWVQPVLTFAKGAAVWGAPRAFDASQAVERVAAELSAKLPEQKSALFISRLHSR